MKNTENSTMKNSDKCKKGSRLISLLAFFMAAVICFTACSGGGRPVETPEPVTTPEATAAPVPVQGGALRCPMPENLHINNEEYNPMLIYTEEALQLFSLVYEPLINIDETNMLIPALAANWAPDDSFQNAWIINLRKNARWHTGETVNADDIVYSYETLRTLGAESYYGSCLNDIVSIEIIDSNTLRIFMQNSGLMALYSLTFPIIKKDAPIFTGTGAYRAVTVTDDKIVLTGNPDWWDRSPYIRYIEFYARSSNDMALASFNAGQLNFVSTAKLAVGQYSEAGVTVVKDIMTQNMETLLFNSKHQITKNADFRKAIAHALDRSTIITNVYMNRARKSDTPFPPDSWLYDSNAALYDYNTQISESLFDSLGYKKGAGGKLFRGRQHITLKLLTSGTTENVTRIDAAERIAAQLDAVGIGVEIITAEHSYGEDGSEFLNLLKAGDWDIALVGFNLSQSNRLNKYIDSDGTNNFGSFSDREIEELIKNMNEAPDEETLRNASYALQQKFIEKLPFIVLYFRLNSVVYDADIKGITDMREPNIVRNVKQWYMNTEQTTEKPTEG